MVCNPLALLFVELSMQTCRLCRPFPKPDSLQPCTRANSPNQLHAASERIKTNQWPTPELPNRCKERTSKKTSPEHCLTMTVSLHRVQTNQNRGLREETLAQRQVVTANTEPLETTMYVVSLYVLRLERGLVREKILESLYVVNRKRQAGIRRGEACCSVRGY